MLLACGGAAVGPAGAGSAASLRSRGDRAGRRRRRWWPATSGTRSASSTCATIRPSWSPLIAVVGGSRWACAAAVFRPLPLGVSRQRVRRPAAPRPGAARRRDLASPGAALPGDRRGVRVLRLPGARREGADATDSRPRPTRMPRAASAPAVDLALPRSWPRPWSLYAIQAAYSADVSNAIENAAFFLVPFAVMFVLLAEVRWTPPPLGRGARRRDRRWACCSPAWRSGSTRRATCCSAGATCFSRTSSTSTSGSTRCSTTPTSSAATWRSSWSPSAPIWPGPADARPRSSPRPSPRRPAGGAGAQLLDHQLRRPGGGAPGRGGAALERALGARRRRGDPGSAGRSSCSSAAPVRAISARRRTSTRPPAAGWTWSGAASSWPEDRPIWGWGSGSFGAAFSRHIERGRRPPSRTRSRSPSPPSRGRSGWSSTWPWWSWRWSSC